MALKMSSVMDQDDVCVTVSGEVDVSCADELRNALLTAYDGSHGDIEVDLSDVPYIDSTGIGVLVGVARRAAAESRAFRTTGLQRNVARVVGMLGLSDELGAGGPTA